MRIAIVIIALALMAVALVDMRRAELVARHEAQRLQLRQVELRRQLWDQQIALSRLVRPAEVQRRSQEMCLDLVAADPAPEAVPRGGR